MNLHKLSTFLKLALWGVLFSTILSGGIYIFQKHFTFGTEQKPLERRPENTSINPRAQYLNIPQPSTKNKSVAANKSLRKNILLQQKQALWFIKEDGSQQKIISYENEEIADIRLSPNGQFISVLHWKWMENSNSLISRGVSIISTISPYTVKELIPPGTDSHLNIRWSPNSQYISYIVSDRNGIEVREIDTGQIVLSLKSKKQHIVSYFDGFARPMVWIDQNRFSYILDNNLYIGTLTSPHENIIANDANNKHCTFMSYDYLCAPDWSTDGRYVSYSATSTFIILDTLTSKKFTFGTLTGGGEHGDFLNISNIGWSPDGKYFYEEDRVLKFIQMPGGAISNLQLPKLTEPAAYNLSPDGMYLATSNPGYIGSVTSVYNLKNNQLICTGLKIRYPLGDRGQGWSENYILGKISVSRESFNTQLAEDYLIVLADINECDIVYQLPIRGNSATFAPSL